MLSTVSIIPGIENIAPERTDTSNGLTGSPRVRPMAASIDAKCVVTSSARLAGALPL